MATEQQRKQLIDQIPSEQGRTAPAVQRLGGMQDSELGRNVVNTAMALPGVGGAAKAVGAVPAVSRLMGAGVTGISTLGGAAKAVAPYAVPAAGLGGASIASQPDQPQTQSNAAQRLGPQPSSAPPGQGQVPAQSMNAPAQTAAAAMPNSQANQINYDSATKTYSGTNVGAGAQIVNGRGGGAISAQNMLAANELAADQQRSSVSRLATIGNVPQSPQRSMMVAPTVSHSGNDFSARKQLENLKTSASSITNTARWGGRNAERNPSVIAYQQALQADLAAQGKQPDMEMQTMGLNAGMAREQLHQDGTNTRAAMGERTAAQRLALDGRRLDGEQEVQGIQTRQAQMIEEAQKAVLNAQTDGARTAAQQRLSTLTGKGGSSYKLHVTPQTKNMDGSTTMGSVFRLNESTGDVQRVDEGGSGDGPVKVSSQQQLNALPAGSVYVGPDGKQYRKE